MWKLRHNGLEHATFATLIVLLNQSILRQAKNLLSRHPEHGFVKCPIGFVVQCGVVDGRMISGSTLRRGRQNKCHRVGQSFVHAADENQEVWMVWTLSPRFQFSFVKANVYALALSGLSAPFNSLLG